MEKTEKFFKKWAWLMIAYGCIIMTIRLIESFNGFHNHISDFGTDKEWRFYFSLIALGIYFFFFLVSVITLIILFIYRDKFKMNISDENKII